MSISWKSKAKEQAQTKGDYWDMTIKCNMWLWTRSFCYKRHLWELLEKLEWSLWISWWSCININFLIVMVVIGLCRRLFLFLRNAYQRIQEWWDIVEQLSLKWFMEKCYLHFTCNFFVSLGMFKNNIKKWLMKIYIWILLFAMMW